MLALCALQTFPLRAAETNSQAVVYSPLTLELESREPSENLLERYNWEMARTEHLFSDRFGPWSQFEWTRRVNRERYGIFGNIASEGSSAFQRSLLDSLRETAVNRLPLDAWKEYWGVQLSSWVETPYSLAVDLFRGSLAHTREESISPVSAIPSYAEIEESHSGLYDVKEDRILSYGFKPWRTKPYAYVTANIGHNGGVPLVYLDLRSSVMLTSRRDIGLIQVQGYAVLPLASHWQLSLAGSACPTKLHSGSLTYRPWASARLERLISTANGTEVGMYVGASSNAYEKLISAGLNWRY